MSQMWLAAAEDWLGRYPLCRCRRVARPGVAGATCDPSRNYAMVTPLDYAQGDEHIPQHRYPFKVEPRASESFTIMERRDAAAKHQGYAATTAALAASAFSLHAGRR